MGGENVIVVGQISSTSSMKENLSQVRVVIQKAVAAGAKVSFMLLSRS